MEKRIGWYTGFHGVFIFKSNKTKISGERDEHMQKVHRPSLNLEKMSL